MLVDADQIEALVETQIPALPGTANEFQKAARDQAVADMIKFYTLQFGYQVNETEILGIETEVDTGKDNNTAIQTAIAAGIPIATDGGVALQTTQGAALTLAGPSKETQSQTNDGKGLIK